MAEMFYLTRFTSYIRNTIFVTLSEKSSLFLKENLQEEIHHAAGVLDINAFEWKRLNEAKPHLSLASILKIGLKVPRQLNWNSYDSWVITIFTCVIVTIINKHDDHGHNPHNHHHQDDQAGQVSKLGRLIFPRASLLNSSCLPSCVRFPFG